jgi:hypothetical protein
MAKKSANLIERVSIGKAPEGGRVDRKAKLIKGVKILGFQSRNPGAVLGKDFAEASGYDYDPVAVKEALPRYEGAPVNLDHLESKRDSNGMRVPNEPRKVGQRFGKLTNVRMGEDGAYADIRYLDSHPLAPMVLEAAEEMPDAFAMSHHAHGDVENPDSRGGRARVSKINEVHSVDLIAEKPGTTTSLYESRTMGDETDVAEDVTTPPESGSLAEDSETGADPCDAICQKAAEIFASDADSKEKLGKLKELLALLDHTKEVLSGDAESSESGESEDEDEDAEKPATTEESADCAGKGNKMEESLKAERTAKAKLERELKEQKAREKACVLLSGKSIPLTEARIAAIAGAKDDAAQKELIESWAPTKIPAKPIVSRPRSSAPMTPSEIIAPPAGSDGKRSDSVLAFLGRGV